MKQSKISPIQFTIVTGVFLTAFSTKAALMNFDSGLITSDGYGDISLAGYFEKPGGNSQYSLLGTNNITLNFAAYDGAAQGSINFYTFDNYGNNGGGFETDTPTGTLGFMDTGNWTGEFTFYINNGGGRQTGTSPLMAIGNAGYYQSGNQGGVAIGSDWLSSGLFSMPNNGLCVEGNVGVGTQSPNYSVDVSGDINFTGALRNNGNAIILPDSSGNGGSTLMLNAQDNGTPMYLHVTSSGVATWTTSP